MIMFASIVSRRVLAVGSRSSSSASEFLESKGYSAALAAAMLKAMSPSPTIPVSLREVQAFGDGGLVAMAQAVERELAAKAESESKPRVTILFNAPHTGLRNARVQARHGSTFMDLAKESTLVGEYLECACNGIAACSTCHVILSPEQAQLFPPPSEAEQDMLDLAADLTPTSRLGCQLTLTEQHNNLKVTVPKTSANLWSGNA